MPFRQAWEKEMTITRPGRTKPSNLRDVPMRNPKLLPTPQSRDWKGCEGRRGDVPSYIQDTMKIGDGKPSQLSPQFVMEMMGFPTDWTLLPFLNGETNQSKQEEMP